MEAQPRRPPSRSEARDAAARAELVPLAPGERPPAVTVATLVALALAVANLAGYLVGPEIARGRPGGQAGPVIVYSALLLGLAWGLWRARYWAVLAVQVALVVLIVVFSMLALMAENLLGALLAFAVIGAAGTLFTFLVRAMARIQAPGRS